MDEIIDRIREINICKIDDTYIQVDDRMMDRGELTDFAIDLAELLAEVVDAMKTFK